MKRKKICPGYKDSFDLMLRDQTATVRSKAVATDSQTVSLPSHQRLVSIGPPASSSTSSVSLVLALERPHHPSAYRHSEEHDEDDGSSVLEINNAIVKTSAEQAVLAEFFYPIILVHGYRQSSRGFLHQLIPAYESCANGSLLHVATNALAFAVNSKGTVRDHLIIGQQKYARALAMMRNALVDPFECRKDETIMAVMVLGFIQVRPRSRCSQCKKVS